MLIKKKSIKKGINDKGFSLVEAILAASIFTLTVSAFAGALIYGQTGSLQTGNRIRAVFLADEGLEVIRNIRDDDFVNLTDGAYGLDIQSGRWELVAQPEVVDIFTRQIDIATINADTKEITASVFWSDIFRGDRSIIHKTNLTNW